MKFAIKKSKKNATLGQVVSLNLKEKIEDK